LKNNNLRTGSFFSSGALFSSSPSESSTALSLWDLRFSACSSSDDPDSGLLLLTTIQKFKIQKNYIKFDMLNIFYKYNYWISGNKDCTLRNLKHVTPMANAFNNCLNFVLKNMMT
jgi:hypothetical protein